MVMIVLCPICYAAEAAACLRAELERGIDAEVRAGMGRGYLEMLGNPCGAGWRFCADHALCAQAHAWLEVGGEADGDVVVTRERCVHCGEERTTERPRELSVRDRVDIREELRETVCVLDTWVASCDGTGYDDATAAAGWRARATRLRQLIALLALLLLSACAASHGRIEGPPLYVHLCDAMPAADAEAWGEAAGALNRELEAAALWVGHGPPRGCDTVDVCPSADVLADAETHVGACTVTVRYAPGTAREVATQELDALLRRWP